MDLRISSSPIDDDASFSSSLRVMQTDLVSGSLDTPGAPGATEVVVFSFAVFPEGIGGLNHVALVAVDANDNRSPISEEVSALVEDVYPPGDIVDLTVVLVGERIRIEFTSPYEDAAFDSGTGKKGL